MQAGDRLGRYRLLRMLGFGGMAQVWEAIDESLQRSVAVKIIREDKLSNPHFGKRFRREAKLVARLDHPHILPIFDFGQEADVAYIVMRYVHGGDLAGRLGKQIPAHESLVWLSALAAALDYAHSQSVIHRDVKPQNVLFDRSGILLLSDFGIGKALDETVGLTDGNVPGTPLFLSPEAVLGSEVDGRCDQYAVGVLAFLLLTGRYPFELQTKYEVWRHVKDDRPKASEVNSSLNPAVDTVFKRVLAVDPGDRYPTCGAFVDDLDAALQSTIPLPASKGSGVALASTVTAPRDDLGPSTRRESVGGNSSAEQTNTFGRQVVRHQDGVGISSSSGTVLPWLRRLPARYKIIAIVGIAGIAAAYFVATRDSRQTTGDSFRRLGAASREPLQAVGKSSGPISHGEQTRTSLPAPSSTVQILQPELSPTAASRSLGRAFVTTVRQTPPASGQPSESAQAPSAMPSQSNSSVTTTAESAEEVTPGEIPWPFCADLKRILSTSAETPPFKSLKGKGAEEKGGYFPVAVQLEGAGICRWSRAHNTSQYTCQFKGFDAKSVRSHYRAMVTALRSCLIPEWQVIKEETKETAHLLEYRILEFRKGPLSVRLEQNYFASSVDLDLFASR